MPRRAVLFARGNYYHIYNRGAGRLPIIREERNYRYLTGLLVRASAACQVTVIAYCLLPNHYHWLVRQDGDTPAGEVARRVFGSYSQAFNRSYQRTGTLFEGRFQAILVDSERYLATLCCYIHCNPVKHGLTAAPEDWPYSNYHEWAGRRHGPLVDRQFILDQFGSAEAYREAARAYLRARGVQPGLPPHLAVLSEPAAPAAANIGP